MRTTIANTCEQACSCSCVAVSHFFFFSTSSSLNSIQWIHEKKKKKYYRLLVLKKATFYSDYFVLSQAQTHVCVCEWMSTHAFGHTTNSRSCEPTNTNITRKWLKDRYYVSRSFSLVLSSFLSVCVFLSTEAWGMSHYDDHAIKETNDLISRMCLWWLLYFSVATKNRIEHKMGKICMWQQKICVKSAHHYLYQR